MSDPTRSVMVMAERTYHPDCPDCFREVVGLPPESPEEIRERVQSHIESHGWATQTVLGDDHSPPWAYSIGLWRSHRSPELIVCGADPPILTSLVNTLGSRVADGARLEPGDLLDDVVPARLYLGPVDPTWRLTYMFAVSVTYYDCRWPPYLQVVWSDEDGRFPWEPGFHECFNDDQPLMWVPREEHPPCTWTHIDDI
jgi:hypothetical protein